jgi:hypothetical protein
MSEKIIFFNKLISLWDSLNVEYSICHGIEHYPTNLGRDIDILIEKKYKDIFLKKSIQVLRNSSFLVITPPNPWNADWIFASNKLINIELDVLNSINYGPIVFTNKPLLYCKLHEIPYDLWAMFVKTYFFALVGGTKTYRGNFTETELNYIKSNLLKFLEN